MRVERKPFGAPVMWWSRPGLVVTAADAVLLAGVVVWVLGPGAVWVLHHLDDVRSLSGKDEADALDAIRGRVLTVATGLLAIVAVYYTARNAHTARRALEHSEESARRTALLTERIARDSARDHATVIEVLAAFLREHSHDDANAPATADELDRDPDAVGWPRSDLQAARTVIRRRDPRHDTDPIDLSRACLRRSDLARADLTGADLTRVNLTGADLTGADLDGATLTDAIGWPS